jgi:hypothetical protein
MFGRRGHDSELERRLRAERPQAPDELVDRLASRIAPVPRPRRATGPRLALIGAITAAIALSLGVAGAIGSARGSIQSFGRGVYHVVQPSPAHTTTVAAPVTAPQTTVPHTTTVSPNHNQGGSGQLPIGFLPSRIHDPNIPPFGFQYGIKVPICYQGHIIFVSLSELFWYFTHGALPAWVCIFHR